MRPSSTCRSNASRCTTGVPATVWTSNEFCIKYGETQFGSTLRPPLRDKPGDVDPVANTEQVCIDRHLDRLAPPSFPSGSASCLVTRPASQVRRLHGCRIAWHKDAPDNLGTTWLTLRSRIALPTVRGNVASPRCIEPAMSSLNRERDPRIPSTSLRIRDGASEAKLFVCPPTAYRGCRDVRLARVGARP